MSDPDEICTNPKGVSLNVWHYRRRGLFYMSRVSWVYPNQDGVFRYSIGRNLGFISYWLIKWIHGPRELERMARAVPEEYFNSPPGEVIGNG